MKVISSRNPFCLRRSGRILLSTTSVNSVVVVFGFSCIMTWRVNIISSLDCWLWTSGNLDDSRGAEKGVSWDSVRRIPYHAPARLPNQVFIDSSDPREALFLDGLAH